MPTLTITTTLDQSQRLATALGRAYGFVDERGQPRPASAAEVKALTIAWMRGIVLDQERMAAALAVIDVTFDPT